MRKTFQKYTFSLEYLKESFDNCIYLLPLHALHRPAAHCIIVKQEYYEPDTHRLIGLIFENLSGSMIHAGTFFGDMLPSFSKAVSGVLWCFEPVVENYILANKCIEENKLKNVFLVNAALSNKVGMVRINTIDSDGAFRGGSSYLDNNGLLTPSITIDNFQYDSLIVLQLDVEGHELKALEGAADTIRKHRPIIMVEDNLNHSAEFLKNVGYTFWASIPGLEVWVNEQNTHVSSVMEKLIELLPLNK